MVSVIGMIFFCGERNYNMDTMKKAGLYLLAAVVLVVCIIAAVINIATGGDKPESDNVTAAPTTTTTTQAVIDESVPPFEISVFSSKSSLAVGEQTIYSAVLIPSQPKVKVCWYSDNDSVVSITTDGVATGISEGTANLMVVCISTDTENPQYNLPQSKCFVSVAGVANTTAGGQVIADRPPAGNRDLLIVNTLRRLDASYAPRVVEVPEGYPTNKVCYLTPEALEAYTMMYASMRKANVGDVMIISAYRSYKKQNELFEAQMQLFRDQGYDEGAARAAAMTTVNPPGCSEHQLGLSIDFSTDGTTQHDFGGLAQGKWLAENAHRYGFVLRYPANKVSVTGIDYEPWHFRYVGVEHATYMYTHGICLEEYVDIEY
ncbi:MAG: hypothetical protein E7546_07550 [Ruminococcaceae bacterium]|nr:hypothetical protein [Oscillospiraceae bacterium]